jgi:hypothetical protein
MTIENRLERLEKELNAAKHRNRRLLTIFILAVGAFALAWTFTKTEGTVLAQDAEKAGKVVRANGFVLEDDQCRVRGKLEMSPIGPGLILYDENGKVRAGLSTFKKEGPSLILSDENGNIRIMMSAAIKDGPNLSLFDENGKYRAMMTVVKDGPKLFFIDDKGTPRAKLGAGQNSTPDGTTITYPESTLILYGPDSKVLWQAP